MSVEDRNDERASEAVQVTKHQRETRPRRNKRATNTASTNRCGFRGICPRRGIGSSHLRAGKLREKRSKCEKKILENPGSNPRNRRRSISRFLDSYFAAEFRLFHDCTHCFSTLFCSAIALWRYALSTISTLFHTCYPHDSQQLTGSFPIARRKQRFYVALPAFDSLRKAPRTHRRRRAPTCISSTAVLQPASSSPHRGPP